LKKSTLITDFDNTLYDWFHMWHQSFGAMLNEIIKISGIDRSVLIPQIRALHQKYHTSEYAFLIENLACLKEKFPQQDLLRVFDEAIHAFRKARKSSLQLYNDVSETLKELRAKNILIVVYTESLGFYTNYRIHKLGLDELVDYVFSPPDHEFQKGEAENKNGFSYNEETRLVHAKHLYIPRGVVKPNPEVLLDIVKEISRSPEECVYVGDSLMKDVAMSQDAGITDVHAAYGGVQHLEEYNLLRQVSHWTDVDVEKERKTSNRLITPTHSLSKFSEIVQLFRE